MKYVGAGHVCELQLVHAQLMAAREGMGGHSIYGKGRAAAELLELAPDRLLYRLFHEEGVRLDPPRPLRFQCRCSREKIVDILQMLGRVEVEQVLHEQGEVAITCEFCGQTTRLDAVDVAQLWTEFEPRFSGGVPDALH